MSTEPRLNRRHWIIAGLATCAGLTTAWFSQTSHAQAQRLAGMRFPTADGDSLAVSQWLNQPLVLNFWASWCPPCIEEMPLLDAFAKANRERGVQLVGLAVDRPEAVRDYLEKNPVSYPIALTGDHTLTLNQAFGNTSGSLPFTIGFDRKGRIAFRKLGKIRAEDLTVLLNAII